LFAFGVNGTERSEWSYRWLKGRKRNSRMLWRNSGEVIHTQEETEKGGHAEELACERAARRSTMRCEH